MPDSFAISLVTPQQLVLETKAKYVSLPAWDGQLGIAPQRAPIVAKLGDGILHVELADGGEQYFFLAGGFAQMKDNRLSILTSEAIEPSAVDLEAARADLEAARTMVPLTDAQVETRDRQTQRAKTLIELKK